jgi:hypothetical protein
MNALARVASAALLVLLSFAPASAADDSPSLGDLQGRALRHRQAQQDFQAVRRQMQEKLSAALPLVVASAVAKLETKGAVFIGVEKIMAGVEEQARSYGIPVRVTYADERKTVGLANGYEIYVFPEGFEDPFELRGDMYWDGADRKCEFWVDFSFNPSKSHPVGKYDCSQFLSGRLSATFDQTFEESVRRGFESQR